MSAGIDILKLVELETGKLVKHLPDPAKRIQRVRAVPQPGPQTTFRECRSVDIRILGGAAGGGKTWALLTDAIDDIETPGFGAVIFRRTYPQITNEGGLWDESLGIYPLFGADPSFGNLEWTFDNTNRVSFRHLQYDKSCLEWLGAQIAYIGFDQLELFTEYQFWYMFTRNRSRSGIRPRIAATVNPDADSWVADLIAWWIDPETGYAIPERAGIVRWFIRKAGELIWGDTKEELFAAHGRVDIPMDDPLQPIQPKSLTFIPARLKDNPALTQVDPGYRANLLAQPEVDRQRLLGDEELGGNWKIRPEAGKLFNQNWFEIVDPEKVPAGGREVRFYDFAATAIKVKTRPNRDPDYTASCKIRRVRDTFYILDATAEQQPPEDTDVDILDNGKRDGKRCKVRWEIEPGSAGIKENLRLVKLMRGFDAMGIRPQGEKFLRSRSFQSSARVGLVKVVRGAWNKRWLAHMHGQPDLPHDDEHDAATGGFNHLNGPPMEDVPPGGSRSQSRAKGRGGRAGRRRR